MGLMSLSVTAGCCRYESGTTVYSELMQVVTPILVEATILINRSDFDLKHFTYSSIIYSYSSILYLLPSILLPSIFPSALYLSFCLILYYSIKAISYPVIPIVIIIPSLVHSFLAFLPFLCLLLALTLYSTILHLDLQTFATFEPSRNKGNLPTKDTKGPNFSHPPLLPSSSPLFHLLLLLLLLTPPSSSFLEKIRGLSSL